MAKYFMGDTRLGWLEKMMMAPSRTSPPAPIPEGTGRRPLGGVPRGAAYELRHQGGAEQYPEHGQVTIPFPIPPEQYDQTIEMLQAMDLGFSRNRDCTVDALDSRFPVLNALQGTLVNVDQLD